MRSRPAAAHETGAALLAVLWLLVVAGGMAGTLAFATRFDALTSVNAGCRLKSHYGAQAGIADAAEWLRRGPPRTTRLARQPGVVLEFADTVGDARYDLEVVDLNSRINVNLATEDMLLSLLQASGLPFDRAQALAQAILDWIDGDRLRRARGAEADDYGALGALHLPRNGPVPALGELLRVRGMTPDILSGVAQWLTVHGSGKINLNTAPREVLAALPGFTPAVVAVVLDLRARRPIHSISDVAADPRLAGAPSLEAVALRLIKLTIEGPVSEGALIRSRAAIPGCSVGAEIDAVLLSSRDRLVVGSWSEAWVP